MALQNTGTAIGRISAMLREQLNSRTGLTITIGRPDPPPGSAGLNIFLYEVIHDGSMRNVPLESDRPAPLWLVLKFLLTAFDNDGSSDSIDAHESLGQAMQALQELSFLLLNDNTDPQTRQALEDNPEPLKLTFDQATTDLLSGIMQGSDEKYRCSTAFQVRPVLIAPAEPAAYAPLVGIDYTQGGQTVDADRAIRATVIAGLGPVVEAVEPLHFEEGTEIAVSGLDLQLADSLYLGEREIPITMQRPDRLGSTVATGADLSPGLYALTARQALEGEKFLSSNPVAVGLIPNLQSVSVPAPLALVGDNLTGVIELTGTQLGVSQDQRFVALVDANDVAHVFDTFLPPGNVPAQTLIRLNIPAPGLAPGGYRVALKINGMRARAMPTIDLEAP